MLYDDDDFAHEDFFYCGDVDVDDEDDCDHEIMNHDHDVTM